MPSNSATILTIEAREPPISGWPVMTTTVPSSLMLTCALRFAAGIEPEAAGDAAALVLEPSGAL